MRRLPALLACAILGLTPLAGDRAVHAGDWGVTRNPFDPVVIARYKGILKVDPYEGTAFARLLDLYRRFRTVDLLKAEYQKELDKAEEWSALVVMGRLFRTTGDEQRALELFGKATDKKPTDAQAWLQIGELQKAASKPKDARVAYDKALANSTNKEMKKKALRALADLALATGDNDGANAYFKQFLDLDPTNAQLWLERGDAMLAAGKREVALESYAAAEKLLGNDPQKRMEVIARRGQALEAMGKDDEAVAEYRRAIKAAPKGYYLEVELTGRIIDIFRKKQALPQLLAQYEKEWPEGARGHFEWNTLGKLYEETGQQDKAIAALRKAVAKSPWELDTQGHLISLLENSGRDDEALAQYEAVVRAAPGEARFQIQLAERYWRRGKEKQALDTVTRMEGRFPTDPGVIAAIADMYTRWGKDDLALVEYEKLAKIEPEDPGHLVTLGEQYWQKGDKVKANATWKRMTVSGKAIGYAKYGEVMSEHGYPVDALANYEKALKLDDKNVEFYKGRAAVYETGKNWGKAIEDYESVMRLIEDKPQNRSARRDARKKLVSLVVRAEGNGKQVDAHVAIWEGRFKTSDAVGIDAGYYLIDYYAKKNPSKLIDTLTTQRNRVADDQELITDLVKAYKDARRYEDAVKLLKELAKLSPSREREVLTQISELKTLERKDDEAIDYAQQALAKAPSDPTAYERLAERYVEMQKFDKAIEAYEKTVKLDAHNSKAMFALAQLYIQNNDAQNTQALKAAELYRTVLRNSSNDEEVGHAADAAMNLEEMTGTLGELEKVMSPLSFVMAHKPVYRRKLVALYELYVPVLAERLRHGTPEIRAAARAELDRIAGHGLQPLLEALRDEKDLGQQRLAVAVLGHLGNKGAAQPLVRIARQEAPKDPRHTPGTMLETAELGLRVDALIAAGRLGDPGVIVDVLPLVDHQESAMREAAIFTIGRTGDKRALAPLVKALDDKQPSVRTLACLGLAQIDDPKAVAALATALADSRKPEPTRAACAYGLGVRRSPAGVAALLGALADNRGDAQRLAAWALGQIGDPKTLGALIRGYFSRAGRPAPEMVWAIGRTSGVVPVDPKDRKAIVVDYPMAGGKFAQNQAIAELPGALPQPPTSSKLVVDHADEIAKGLVDALAEHRDVVVSVLADLDATPNQLSLGALALPSTADARLATALDAIAVAIAPAIKERLTADDPKVRALAISVLAKLDGKVTGADQMIEKALTDSTDQVREAAMNAVATLAVRRGAAPTALVATLVKQLQTAPWADRRVAALAIGRLGPHADLSALARAAADPSNFVREAVATAYGAIGSAAVADPLIALSRDGYPSVRAAAAASLGRVPGEAARKRRAELAADPDPTVQAAAKPTP